MTMRVLLVLAAIGFSVNAFAQDAPPKVGNKPLAQVKPKEPMGCKLVGTVKRYQALGRRLLERGGT